MFKVTIIEEGKKSRSFTRETKQEIEEIVSMFWNWETTFLLSVPNSKFGFSVPWEDRYAFGW